MVSAQGHKVGSCGDIACFQHIMAFNCHRVGGLSPQMTTSWRL